LFKFENFIYNSHSVNPLSFNNIKKEDDRMAKEEEGPYEIMPYEEISALKKEIAELKSRSNSSSQDLLGSIATLTKSMNDMLQLFTAAAEEMKLEEKTESGLAGKVEPIMDRLDEIIEQNKTIADGMVAIADMVKDTKEKKAREAREEREKPVNRQMPREPILPEYHPGQRRQSMQPSQNEMPELEMPPFPDEEELPPLGPLPPEGPMSMEMPSWPEPNMPAGPLAGGPMPPPLPEEKPRKRGLFGRR